MDRRRLVMAFVALIGAAQCGTTGTPPPAHVFPVQEYTLPSGLRVVIEQDEVSTIAGIVVIVDAGLVDNPPGKAGIAHVLEHLIFRVPDETGASVHRRLLRLGAAAFNAETDIERTTYHAFGPRQTLDQLVTIVLGRLADPLRGATQLHVDKETSITAEEMRKREGAAGYEFVVPALLPTGHPSSRAYAEIRQSDKLSLADVKAFADVFYRPERMTVVISGPLPPGWEKSLWARLPASLHGQESTRRPPVRRPLATFDGSARAETDLSPHKGNVTGPELWMAWRAPPAVGVEAKTAPVLAHVVQQVLSSRLDPHGTNDILDVDGFVFPGSLATVVGCRFKLRAAGDAVRIRNETRGALEALADVTLMHVSGRLWWSHVRALQAAKLTTALTMESTQGRTLARAELAHTRPDASIARVLEALARIDAANISEFAGHYLKPEASRAVLVVPEDMQAVRRPLRPTGGDDPVVAPTSETASETEEPEHPDKAKLLAITQGPGARAAQVRKLSNGLTVIAMRRPGLPFVSLLLGFHAEPQAGDAPGARLAFDHALHWRLSEGPLERGLLRASNRTADSIQESLSLSSASVDDALDFLSEESDSLHVYWPNPEFERSVDQMAMVEATPDARSARALRNALFGDHPYHLTPASADVRKVTERQVEAWFERVRRPANGAMIVVGELEPETVFRTAEKMLHGWKGDSTAPLAPPPPPAAPARQQAPANVVYTQDPRRRSADLRFGCFLPPVRTQRDQVVNDLLGAVFDGALYGHLRWNLGVSYAPDVEVEFVRGGTAWFNGRVDIDARALPEALEVLHLWLDAGTESPISAKHFEQVRWGKARRSGLANATAQQLARSLFRAWNMGWGLEVLDDYPRDLASVRVDDIAAALAVCRKSAVISVLGPGPSPGGTTRP